MNSRAALTLLARNVCGCVVDYLNDVIRVCDELLVLGRRQEAGRSQLYILHTTGHGQLPCGTPSIQRTLVFHTAASPGAGCPGGATQLHSVAVNSRENTVVPRIVDPCAKPPRKPPVRCSAPLLHCSPLVMASAPPDPLWRLNPCCPVLCFIFSSLSFINMVHYLPENLASVGFPD